ncbi:hypothetical protein B0H16DRAFT_1486312 [Mycena metata]|uniref:Uncharacterized protein n=1 Tax=Mycena metata TaxID=1033252 RepID=A0AAD7DIV9_9AGAR|nr:hypothetical protein B0H16DRAFT_1486312 [Mycena metata]
MGEVSGRRGLTINLPSTLRMDGPHIANEVDQDTYRLSMARKVKLSRAAEARVYTLLIEETKIALARRQAEIELAQVRAEEERLRLEYYQQMNEAAESNLLDADMQIGVVRHQIWGNGAARLVKIEDDEYLHVPTKTPAFPLLSSHAAPFPPSPPPYIPYMYRVNRDPSSSMSLPLRYIACIGIQSAPLNGLGSNKKKPTIEQAAESMRMDNGVIGVLDLDQVESVPGIAPGFTLRHCPARIHRRGTTAYAAHHTPPHSNLRECPEGAHRWQGAIQRLRRVPPLPPTLPAELKEKQCRVSASARKFKAAAEQLTSKNSR